MSLSGEHLQHLYHAFRSDPAKDFHLLLPVHKLLVVHRNNLGHAYALIALQQLSCLSHEQVIAASGLASPCQYQCLMDRQQV